MNCLKSDGRCFNNNLVTINRLDVIGFTIRGKIDFSSL